MKETGQESEMEILPRLLPSKSCCGHRGDVKCVRFLEDGSLVASTGDDGMVNIYKVDNGELTSRLSYEGVRVNALAWITEKSSLMLATGCSDGTIRTWIVKPNRNPVPSQFRTFEAEVKTLDYDAASCRLFAATETTVIVWNLQREPVSVGDGEQLLSKLQCRESIGGLGVLKAGRKCIVSLTKSRLLLFVMVKDDGLKKTKTVQVDYTPHRITISEDSASFAIGGLDGTIHIYDWKENYNLIERTVVHYHRYCFEPRPVTFSFVYGTRLMVSGGEQEVATLWDLRDGRRIASFTHQKGCYIFAVTGWSNSEVVRLVTASSHGRYYVVLWECPTSSLLAKGSTLFGAIRLTPTTLCSHDSRKLYPFLSFLLVVCLIVGALYRYQFHQVGYEEMVSTWVYGFLMVEKSLQKLLEGFFDDIAHDL